MTAKLPLRRAPGALLFMLMAASALPLTVSAQSGPKATPEEVAAALVDTPKIPNGPYEATWDSIKANYQTPQWFLDDKFGLFMHFGLYSVPAHQSEWYEKYMYGSNMGIAQWHIDHYGPADKFGYLEFLPMFATKFDPDAWAKLFKASGAKYIVPTAQHHDGFALWDSALTKWNAKQMGPKRDIIGELAVAVRKQGLKFGVSNHEMEHFTFIVPPPASLKTDLNDPAKADFFLMDKSPAALVKFLNDWVKRNYELIDKYQPDILWFDNGVNSRVFDPLKLAVAAYYYNRAAEWGKQVSLSTKANAYLAGSIEDYEREGRAPKTMTDFPWEADDPIGEKFGYVEGMKLNTSSGVIRNLIENVSRNGNLLLNISPKGDGTIPDEQQQILLGVGKWLDMNGDAIYGTRAWKIYGEGNLRYTTKGDTFYAIVLPGRAPANGTAPTENSVVIPALVKGKGLDGAVTQVELLGHDGNLTFTWGDDGLKVKLPEKMPVEYAYALRITGLKLPKLAVIATVVPKQAETTNEDTAGPGAAPTASPATTPAGNGTAKASP
jgi:alpha-L-fucosidase